MKKEIDVFKWLYNYLLPPERLNPVDWAKKYIDFSGDFSAPFSKIDFSFSPFLVEPVSYWNFRGRKCEMTVCAPEQTGKTLVWLIGLIWSMVHEPCISIVVYPSAELAEKINKTKVQPLIKAIPSLAEELKKQYAVLADRYNFSNCISYFYGAGARVTSLSARIRIADEVDDWEMVDQKNDVLKDLRKRARSYKDSIFIKVCTPKRKTGLIWREFLKSSRGFFHLRCQNCNDLTIKSCDVRNLLFERESSSGIPIPESIRLVCPKCGFKHEEKHRFWMIENGGYIHEVPERYREHAGFQWGGLAVKFDDFSWARLAEACVLLGRTGDRSDRIYFFNSICGLPYEEQKIEEKAFFDVKIPRGVINPEECSMILFSADTQDDGFFWVVRAWEKSGNSFLIDHGFSREVSELLEVFNRKYLNGQVCAAGIIDSGGHRTQELYAVVKNVHGLFLYKGNSRSNCRFELKPGTKLIIANPKIYQGLLLYQIFQKKNWFVTSSSEEYMRHILAMAPNSRKKDGSEYENWTNNDKPNHFFDAEKMVLVLFDFVNHIKNKKH